MIESANDNSIVFFDGVCNFCNSSVNLIIKHDKKNKYKFATLQSETGKKLLSGYAIDTSEIDSIILLEKNEIFIKSTAILKITKQLNGLYPLLYLFIVFPKFMRDFIYDFIARNRYKWWGKKDSCMIPTKEVKEKFIS